MLGEQVVRSVEEMRQLAAQVAAELCGGDVVLLYGELGAGKTTFVQGLAKALGVAEQITSPTFTIVGDYAVSHHPVIRRLVHVDLYRLEERAAADPAVQDVLAQADEPDRATIIEWADRLGEAVLPEARRLHFDYGEAADQRLVTFR